MREGYIGGRYDRIRSSSTSKLRLLPSQVRNGTDQDYPTNNKILSKVLFLCQDIGEYEEPRRRKSAPEPRRPSGGRLFPLSEAHSNLLDKGTDQYVGAMTDLLYTTHS